MIGRCGAGPTPNIHVAVGCCPVRTKLVSYLRLPNQGSHICCWCNLEISEGAGSMAFPASAAPLTHCLPIEIVLFALSGPCALAEIQCNAPVCHFGGCAAKDHRPNLPMKQSDACAETNLPLVDFAGSVCFSPSYYRCRSDMAVLLNLFDSLKSHKFLALW